MKEPRSIIDTYEEARSRGKACVLATVVKVTGSAYRRPGARLLITEDGGMAGCVSGGCLEADIRERALAMLVGGSAQFPTHLVVYETTEDDIVFGTGSGCPGTIEVLVERLPDVPGYLTDLSDTLRRREPAVLATVFRVSADAGARAGDRVLVTERGALSIGIERQDLAQSVCDDASWALSSQQSLTKIYDLGDAQVEVFFEAILSPIELAIFGAGPSAQPLSRIAHELGWHVRVIDHRRAFAAPERFPEADDVHLLAQPDALPFPVGRRTAAVIMTHSFLQDLAILQALLAQPAGYIGLLSSRARSVRLLKELPAELARSATERLFTPVGLDIGADTPESIALSIAAQIQAAHAGKGASAWPTSVPSS